MNATQFIFVGIAVVNLSCKSKERKIVIMIEIIKAGTKKKITCHECGAVLSYEDEDVKTERNPQDRWNPDKQYIVCPQCNSVIVLKAVR